MIQGTSSTGRGVPLVSAEAWPTTREERTEGDLSRVYGAMALISGLSGRITPCVGEQPAGVGVDPYLHALLGHDGQHVVGNLGDGCAGIVGQGPFGQPL